MKRNGLNHHLAKWAWQEFKKAGVTKPVDYCQVCQGGPYKFLSPHHSDYSLPLDVVWVCIPCHRHWHFPTVDRWKHKADAWSAYGISSHA